MFSAWIMKVALKSAEHPFECSPTSFKLIPTSYIIFPLGPFSSLLVASKANIGSFGILGFGLQMVGAGVTGRGRFVGVAVGARLPPELGTKLGC